MDLAFAIEHLDMTIKINYQTIWEKDLILTLDFKLKLIAFIGH